MRQECVDKVAPDDFVCYPVGHHSHRRVTWGHTRVALAADDILPDDVWSASIVDSFQEQSRRQRQHVEGDDVEHVGDISVEQNVEVEESRYPEDSVDWKDVTELFDSVSTHSLCFFGQGWTVLIERSIKYDIDYYKGYRSQQ